MREYEIPQDLNEISFKNNLKWERKQVERQKKILESGLLWTRPHDTCTILDLQLNVWKGEQFSTRNSHEKRN